MVIKVKSLEVTKKIKAATAKSVSAPNAKRVSIAKAPRRSAMNDSTVQDAPYSEAQDATSHASQAAAAKRSIGHLIARGKDLVSGENSSLIAAAAIVVGAALIEVELIPGLIIGAGAILLGKLFPEMGDYVRPAIKGALHAGFVFTQKIQEVVAETSEQVHDLVAEVKHEHKHSPAEHSASAHSDKK